MESQNNKTIKWKVKEVFDKIYRELRIINDKPVSDYFRTLLKQIIYLFIYHDICYNKNKLKTVLSKLLWSSNK